MSTSPSIHKLEKEKKGNALFYAIVSFTVVFIAWQLLADFTNFGNLFPSPLEVFQLFIKSTSEPIGRYTVQAHLSYTLYRIFIGYLIGSSIGIVTGIAMGSSKTIDAIIRPVFDILRPIPAIAWIPLAILWFGIGENSKYFIIGISTFIIVTLNSYSGARRTSPVLIGAAKMLGAKDSQVFYKVVLPSSVPQIFAGLQVALSSACNTVLAAEMVRSSEGAGWLIIKGMEISDMTRIMVGILAISVSGLLLATAIRAIERRVVSWNIRGT